MGKKKWFQTVCFWVLTHTCWQIHICIARETIKTDTPGRMAHDMTYDDSVFEDLSKVEQSNMEKTPPLQEEEDTEKSEILFLQDIIEEIHMLDDLKNSGEKPEDSYKHILEKIEEVQSLEVEEQERQLVNDNRDSHISHRLQFGFLDNEADNLSLTPMTLSASTQSNSKSEFYFETIVPNILPESALPLPTLLNVELLVDDKESLMTTVADDSSAAIIMGESKTATAQLSTADNTFSSKESKIALPIPKEKKIASQRIVGRIAREKNVLIIALVTIILVVGLIIAMACVLYRARQKRKTQKKPNFMIGGKLGTLRLEDDTSMWTGDQPFKWKEKKNSNFDFVDSFNGEFADISNSPVLPRDREMKRNMDFIKGVTSATTDQIHLSTAKSDAARSLPISRSTGHSPVEKTPVFSKPTPLFLKENIGSTSQIQPYGNVMGASYSSSGTTDHVSGGIRFSDGSEYFGNPAIDAIAKKVKYIRHTSLPQTLQSSTKVAEPMQKELWQSIDLNKGTVSADLETGNVGREVDKAVRRKSLM